MEKEYVKSLEDRIEELENALKLLYPTTENILRTNSNTNTIDIVILFSGWRII